MMVECNELTSKIAAKIIIVIVMVNMMAERCRSESHRKADRCRSWIKICTGNTLFFSVII